MSETTQVEDRVTTRYWEMDLSLAGKAPIVKTRPANRRRQQIARFLGREGTIERFSIRQTIPYCGYEVPCPPTQAQYGAVVNFFLEPCETRFQASSMLSARDYAEKIMSGYRFSAPRSLLLWICTTAFILSDKDLRSLIRAWNIAHRDRSPAFATGTYRKCYKKVSKFASRLVDDMRGSGSEIFG